MPSSVELGWCLLCTYKVFVTIRDDKHNNYDVFLCSKTFMHFSLPLCRSSKFLIWLSCPCMPTWPCSLGCRCSIIHSVIQKIHRSLFFLLTASAWNSLPNPPIRTQQTCFLLEYPGLVGLPSPSSRFILLFMVFIILMSISLITLFISKL